MKAPPRALGFQVNHDLLAENSWYFRNALVRANYKDHRKGIHATNEFLLRFFENLLMDGKHELKNRELHVSFTKTVNDTVFLLISQDEKITSEEISELLQISISTAKRKIKELKEKGMIERVGSDKTGFWKIIDR